MMYQLLITEYALVKIIASVRVCKKQETISYRMITWFVSFCRLIIYDCSTKFSLTRLGSHD